MPRPFGGHTALGQELNNLGAKTSEGLTEKHSQKMGKIVAYASERLVTGADGSQKRKLYKTTDPKADGLYRFVVRFSTGKETGFLPFAGTSNEQAALKGHPSTFLNKSCLVVFKGPSANRGVILNIIDDFTDGEQTGASNQLQVTGAAFAPPGNGLI
mgnify:CR=1 FL=1